MVRSPAHPSRLRPAVAALLLVFSLVLGTAGPAAAWAPLLRSAPIGQAAPAAEALVQVNAVEDAYNLLQRYFAHPLDSRDLLLAGWQAVAAEAEVLGVASPGPAPALAGDPAADLPRFRTALFEYITRLEARPAGFMPGHSAVRGMARSVEEGHTFFLDPQRYQDFLNWTRGDVHYGGIGARMRGPGLTVQEVFPDSPAERAGLRSDDAIEQIDGVSTEGIPLEQTVEMVRGPEGEPVRLVVRRPGLDDAFEVVVVRERIQLDFVAERLLDDQVGYIALRGFPEPSVIERIDQAMQRFEQAGVRALVFDLRGNSGGRIDVGERLLGRFLPPGSPLYRQITRGGTMEVFARQQPYRYDLPMAVLIDGGSASMAEVFASAVQENGTARVFGATSAGSVAAGQMFPLSDGSALQITVWELVSGNGAILNRVGVVPDEAIEVTPGGQSGDQVLARATEWLHVELAASAPMLDLAPAA